MGQSTDENKLQLSFKYKFWHGAHAHKHDLQTVLVLELFETPKTMTNSKFLCYINEV